MDHHHRSGSRGPFGEALIVISVIVGFFWLLEHGKVSLQGTWEYVGFLAAIVVFYFALLLCRIIFFHATGGGGDMPWWAQMELHNKANGGSDMPWWAKMKLQKKERDEVPRKK